MITHDNAAYRPGDLRVSKLRFYSIGVVAENKALASNIIEVTPIEELPMLDGEISAKTDTLDASGEDASGKQYQSSVTTGNSIQAEWLRLGDANRFTAPDVRRGESVVIYQFGDADKYWWNTLKNDSQLRKLETVVYAFSGTPDNSVDTLDHTNTYYFEVSTHTKQITLHTSQTNGEPFGYDLQINTNLGYILFHDTIGNSFTLDSRTHTLRMANTDGSYIDLTKKILTMYTPDKVIINTNDYTLNCKNDTTNSNNTTVNSSSTSINASTATITASNTTVNASTATINGSGTLALVSPGLSLS